MPRTQGWVAGVRLAALLLRGHPEPQRFLDAFNGDERPVADYLADEVLSADAGDLLQRISITDPGPASLAAELSGRPDAAELLSDLERTTGLVVSAGPHRTEFRVHELMRSYLMADLQR
jgi:LuxR family maltose regulon positive regulatory protein